MGTQVYSFRAPVGYIAKGVNVREAIATKMAWCVFKGILAGALVYWSGQKVVKSIQNMKIVNKSKQGVDGSIHPVNQHFTLINGKFQF